MIASIEIQKLRGIRHATIDGLRPLTILLGRNGCGKSSVLEALGVACAGTDAGQAFAAMAAREWLGLAGMAYWWDANDGASTIVGLDPPPDGLQVSRPGWLVTSRRTLLRRSGLDGVLLQAARDSGEKGDLACLQVILTASGTHGAMKDSWAVGTGLALINDDGYQGWQRDAPQARIPYAFHGTFPDRRAGSRRRFETPRFSSALREALTAIKLTPWYEDFVKYLRELRPRLDTIESIAVGDRDEPFAFERDPRVGYPIAYAGDGFRRALLIASALAEAKGGVAALDEPEAFEHPSMFPALTRLFQRALADETQVVVATHSLEFVRAVLQELGEGFERVAIVGLRFEDGNLSPTVIAGPDAHRRVVELGDDLRL